MYERLKRVVLDVINCDDGAPSAKAVADKITSAYQFGEISNSQHSFLIRCLHDVM